MLDFSWFDHRIFLYMSNAFDCPPDHKTCLIPSSNDLDPVFCYIMLVGYYILVCMTQCSSVPLLYIIMALFFSYYRALRYSAATL